MRVPLALAMVPGLAPCVLAGQFTTYFDEACTDQDTFYSAEDIGANCIAIEAGAVGITSRWGGSIFGDEFLVAYSDAACTTPLGTLPSDHTCWSLTDEFDTPIMGVKTHSGLTNTFLAVPDRNATSGN